MSVILLEWNGRYQFGGGTWPKSTNQLRTTVGCFYSLAGKNIKTLDLP